MNNKTQYLSLIFSIFFFFLISSSHSRSLELNNVEQEQIEEIENYINSSPESDNLNGNSLEIHGSDIFGLGSPDPVSVPLIGIGPGTELEGSGGQEEEIGESSGSSVKEWPNLNEPSPLLQNGDRKFLGTRPWLRKGAQKLSRKKNKNKSKMQRLNRLSYYLGEPAKRQRQNTIIYRQCFFNPISCF